MPIYEYKCPRCGKFEKMHGINTNLKTCPSCTSKVIRLISKNVNVLYKADGFYNTDNKANTSSSNNKDLDQHLEWDHG